MPDVKYQKLITRYTVEDDIGIAQNRHAAMTSIIDDAADLWKEIQRVDRGFDRAQYSRKSIGITFAQISGNAVEIAQRSRRVNDIHRPCERQNA